jgi:PIN domain nuclease of toxin-antitoxin system
VRVLLDTHTWLWWLSTPELLNDSARAILGDRQNQLVLSTASAWEIAIKVSIGKLELPGPIDTFMTEQLRLDAIEVLGIELRHILHVVTLPHHHRDPFDRMLVAQAMVESLPVLTADSLLRPYGAALIWAG